MTPSTESDLSKRLKMLQIDSLGRPLGEIARLRALDRGDDRVSLELEFGLPLEGLFHDIERQVVAAVQSETGVDDVRVGLATRVVAHGVQRNLKPLDGISNLIAVASGKGGVGKSTVAVNLALALAADGGRVGVLDADIYGPSQPQMLGLSGQKPVSEDGKTMQPLEAHGLQVMSVGFLVDPDQPMVWRGPMVTSALNQLLRQTAWQALDYLIVDMPPGTGDIQLTLSQQVPVSGAVIVTTPQDIAAIDARKGLAMFRKVSVPVLGVVENMSTHVCSACGHEEAIFGSGGADRIAADFDVEILGRLPLEARIRAQTDSGTPTVAAEPESAAAGAFRHAARRMAAALATQSKDYAGKFPKIVVED